MRCEALRSSLSLCDRYIDCEAAGVGTKPVVQRVVPLPARTALRQGPRGRTVPGVYVGTMHCLAFVTFAMPSAPHAGRVSSAAAIDWSSSCLSCKRSAFA